MKIRLLIDVAGQPGLTKGRIFEVVRKRPNAVYTGRWVVHDPSGGEIHIFEGEAEEVTEEAPAAGPAPIDPTRPGWFDPALKSFALGLGSMPMEKWPAPPAQPAQDAEQLLRELLFAYAPTWHYETGKIGYECNFCGALERERSALHNAANHGRHCPYPAAMQYIKDHGIYGGTK